MPVTHRMNPLVAADILVVVEVVHQTTVTLPVVVVTVEVEALQ